jgi:cohesin complex subunit SA-1/2
VEAVRDWQSILDILLLDHSGSGAVSNGAPSSSKVRKKSGNSKVQATRKGKGKGSPGKAALDDDAVDEAWRLDEREESILVDVLFSSLQKALSDENSKRGVCEISTVGYSDFVDYQLGRLRCSPGGHITHYYQRLSAIVREVSSRSNSDSRDH